MMNPTKMASPIHPAAWLAALLLLLAPLALGCAKPSGTTGSGKAQAKAAHEGTDQAAAAKHGNYKGCDAECQKHVQTAVLAGGCFWGMEELLRQIDGVVDTEVGYTGGNLSAPTYEDVKQGNTGHAESVRVVFDSRKLSYETLLEKWFFRMHDPTTENRQGNDRGTQYRSAIFTLNKEQRTTALAVIGRVEKSGKWKDSIVTEVTEAGPFTPAEDYHQDYLQKNPSGYTCHYLRD